MNITVRPLTGPQILDGIAALGQLRMTVFAAWPYLYEGDATYEAEYLRAFAGAPDGVLVAAFDDARIVGAATASPMAAQSAEVRALFEARGTDLADLFYFGESVLLPQYRRQGIGHAFFDHREAQAHRCGARAATFAAVVRPVDHPDRPDDYTPLDPFWRKRGYEPVEGLVGSFAWKDHRDEHETAKPMQYWLRRF